MFNLVQQGSSPMYLMKRKGAYAGFTSKANRSYVIGLNDKLVANDIAIKMSHKKTIQLHRSDIEDISLDVSMGLRMMGIDIVQLASEITIDTKAELVIYKDPFLEVDQESDENQIAVDTMSYEDFLSMPFEKGLGVIMPYQLIVENASRYLFLSKVIDPCPQTHAFRKNLKV